MKFCTPIAGTQANGTLKLEIYKHFLILAVTINYMVAICILARMFGHQRLILFKIKFVLSD